MARKLKQKEKTTWDLFVHYDRSEQGGNISEGQEDSAWPNYDPLYIEQTVTNISTDTNKRGWNYDRVGVEFEPKEGQTVYLVSVQHSDGNTFGSSHGHQHYEGIYLDSEKAESVAKSIRLKGYQGYAPWSGYFNSLEGIEVSKHIINDYTIRRF